MENWLSNIYAVTFNLDIIPRRLDINTSFYNIRTKITEIKNVHLNMCVDDYYVIADVCFQKLSLRN